MSDVKKRDEDFYKLMDKLDFVADVFNEKMESLQKDVNGKFDYQNLKIDFLLKDVNSKFDNQNLKIDFLQKDVSEFKINVDKKFENIDKRFENIDKRFESVIGRFESDNKKQIELDKKVSMIWWLGGFIIPIITSLVVIIVKGFFNKL